MDKNIKIKKIRLKFDDHTEEYEVGKEYETMTEDGMVDNKLESITIL
jgi:hypothetical protein